MATNLVVYAYPYADLMRRSASCVGLYEKSFVGLTTLCDGTDLSYGLIGHYVPFSCNYTCIDHVYLIPAKDALDTEVGSKHVQIYLIRCFSGVIARPIMI